MQSHQELGDKLNLFFVNDVSTGSIFWKPRGAILYNNLIAHMRNLYEEYDYQEVITPNIFDKKLWMTSGHWDKYKENMFIIEHDRLHDDVPVDQQSEISESVSTIVSTTNEKQDHQHHDHERLFSLKAMGCPGHCMIFKELRPHYKDLPIRMAEFGVLHRNEASGALNGLFRVRRFQQDDAHIFCKMEDIQTEVFNVLEMLDRTYKLFDIPYKICLSTRPEKFLGTVEVWDKAEKMLADAIKQFTKNDKIKIKHGDGAFYGPKIDVMIVDRLKRENQCGTIQLDFQLPSAERFDLKYLNPDQTTEHPVIIHRAVLGSIERFIGILLECTQGHLPVSVSPYPIGIVTVHPEFNDSAVKLQKALETELKKNGIKMKIDVDTSNDDIRDKVKGFERLKYCYILTVGEKEHQSMNPDVTNAVFAVRNRKQINNMGFNEFIDMINQKI